MRTRTPEEIKILKDAAAHLLEQDERKKALIASARFWHSEAQRLAKDVRFWQFNYLVMVIFAFALVLWIGFS